MTDILRTENAVQDLERATDKFKEIITTEQASVDVPGVGQTPSLKARVDAALQEPEKKAVEAANNAKQSEQSAAADAQRSEDAALRAEQAISQTVIWGGDFTPTPSNEYPDTSAINKNTEFKIKLDRDQSYTFIGGQLIGIESRNLDTLIFETKTQSFLFIPSGIKDAVTSNELSNVTSAANNLQTKREAITWRPGLRVTNDLQLYLHVDADGFSREYLPDSEAVPFTTGSTFIDDAKKFKEETLATKGYVKDSRIIPYTADYSIKDGITNGTQVMLDIMSKNRGYEVQSGASIEVTENMPNTTRGMRPFNGPYKFTYGGRKIQKETFGIFDDACSLSVWASHENFEQGTQILGAGTGQAIAQYGDVDTAALFLANYDQPAKLSSTSTTYTVNSVTIIGLDTSILRVNQVCGVEIGDDLYVGLLKGFNGETIIVDGWFKLKDGSTLVPPAGSKFLLNVTTRAWGENLIVEILPTSTANSAVGNETMFNLSKAGSGARSQIFKAINNNLIGEKCWSAYEALGLFQYGYWAKQGCDYAFHSENAKEAAYDVVQSGDAFQTASGFKTRKSSSASFACNVGFESTDDRSAFVARNPKVGFVELFNGLSSRFKIDATGKLFQTLGVAENTLISQFGINSNAGVSIYQSAGVGAAFDATMRIGKNSTTNRSIAAAGTINASGADYAEYMTKRDDCGIILAGDICGIDSNGKLTDSYDLAVNFCVKSTNPSMTGNDQWFTEDEPDIRPNEWHEWNNKLSNLVAPTPPVKPSKPRDSTLFDSYNQLMQQYLIDKQQYDQDYSDFIEALNNHLSSEPTHQNPEHVEWELRKEKARLKVDRIAFCGQIPINAVANVGDYIIPINNNGLISGCSVSNPTFEQYKKAVGKVIKIENNKPVIIVKVL